MHLWRAAIAVTALALAPAMPAAAQSRAEGQAADGARSHAVPSPRTAAARLTGPITMDGRLDEPFWRTAPAATDFRQHEPIEGEPARHRTEVRFGFDGTDLYVGARMFDDEGRAGVRTRLVRRDQETDSDWLQLVFDTYHNHLGRTIFAINPSGVRRDLGQATDAPDQSWDPIWEAATSVDSLGWTAELRIPFSQLRFASDPVQTWGLQIWRTASRSNEVSMWSFSPKDEAGGPPRFGHLESIERPTGGAARAELLPYLVSRFDALQPGDPADPFHDQHGVHVRAGADAKVRLGSSFTLDATVNPDFGQVEVDPAVVNLSAFETFFPERRPFFVEGGQTFNFGGFSCYFCSNASSTSLFYSRRIGRQPQGLLPDGTSFARVPDATTILGAAKITGRTSRGTTVGVLNATTSRETATALVGGQRVRQEVEPLTNYFVARVKQDRSGGNLVVGAMATSVARFGDDPLVDARLPAHAESFGGDWVVRWKQQRYSVMGNVAVSSVAGDPSAIDRLQRSSARYRQRPDRDGDYDPGATAMRGITGYTRLGKDAGDWLWETSASFRTSGFETNDLAFNTRSDFVWANANVMRAFNKPTSWYRSLWLIGGAQHERNFDGDHLTSQLHGYLGGQLANYWGFSVFAIRRTDGLDDRATRGGPLVKNAGLWFLTANLTTDGRKPVSLGVTGELARGDERNWERTVAVSVYLRPASNVSIQLAPRFNRGEGRAQYVTTVADPTATAFYGNRYVFSDLRQTTFGFDTRVNLTMTPNLTFELFAQPLISSVDFGRFKEYAAPRQLRKLVYGEDVGTIGPVQTAGQPVTGYLIDPDGTGPAAPFTIDNPDFNFRSLRGNAILRWE